MYNRLEKIIQKVNGNVLVMCLDDSLLDKFDKNSKVNLYAIYSNNFKKAFRKDNKRKTNKGKNINIKKLRKYLNKKSVDYLFCNMDELNSYNKYIIKDIIYLNNNTSYIYFSNQLDKEIIINRFKRYNVEIEINEYKNGFLLTVDNKNSKNYFIKDRLYYIKDTFYNIAEFIGNILAS